MLALPNAYLRRLAKAKMRSGLSKRQLVFPLVIKHGAFEDSTVWLSRFASADGAIALMARDSASKQAAIDTKLSGYLSESVVTFKVSFDGNEFELLRIFAHGHPRKSDWCPTSWGQFISVGAHEHREAAMAVCQTDRYRGLAVLVRSYKDWVVCGYS